jgi:hypothetical protein
VNNEERLGVPGHRERRELARIRCRAACRLSGGSLSSSYVPKRH